MYNEFVICSSCENKVKPIKLIVPTHVGCPECFTVSRIGMSQQEQEKEQETKEAPKLIELNLIDRIVPSDKRRKESEQ